MPALPISAVERDTGLSKDTLRVWERRYGFPLPGRDALGERTYPPEQVEKLRLIKRLLDQGWRPGKLMATPAGDLAALLEQTGTPREAPAASDKLDALLPLIRQHRSQELRAMLSQLLIKLGLQKFVLDIVAPFNDRIGEAWMRGEIEVFEEHLYTEQIQNVLRGAINAHLVGAHRPRVLLTTLPEEEHGLGLLMAEALLVADGAQCVSLGTRTPLSDIRAAVIASAADVVALSFSAAYPARNAFSALNTLRNALPESTAIWAGGGALRDRGRHVPGVRVIGDIGDTLEALREWHSIQRGDLS
jgi:DNA-binding transcriptional MerR regulator/methylmalonyl-CoA mutase cobalamin-binding subunit